MRWLRDNVWLLPLLVVDLAVRADGLADPWLRGHRGFSGALSGIIARNYNRLGYLNTELMPVWHSGPASPDELVEYAHLRHPFLRYLFTSVFTGVFGLHEWAITLLPILFSLGGALALYLLVKRIWGKWAALLAVAFLAIAPMDVYYGSTSLYEPIGMCFALFALYFYSRWLEREKSGGGAGLPVAMLICLWLATWTDYPGFYMVGLIGLHFLLFGPQGRRKWALLAGLGVFAVFCFGLWVGYVALVSGSAHTFVRGVELRAGTEEARFTAWAYYTLEYLRIREFFTPALRLLAIVWAVFCLIDLRDSDARRRHSWVALLLGYGLANLVVFRQGSWVHDYWLFFLSPFFAVASAAAIRELSRRVLGGRKVMVAVLLLAVWAWYLTSAADSLQTLYRPRDAAETPLARWLHERTAFEEGVMVGFEPLQPHFDYYLDRRLAEFDEPEEFERLRRDGRYRWCVLRSPRTLDEALVKELIRTYPAEAFQNYLVFDLWGENEMLRSAQHDMALPLSTAGLRGENGMLRSAQHDMALPLSTAGLRGEKMLLAPGVTLLGYDGPAYVRLPKGSDQGLLRRYLHSTAARGDDIPPSPVEFTLYWQAGEDIASDIRPVLKLTADDGTRRYVAESIYAPVTDLYTTGLWSPGEVITAPYRFDLSEDYPPGVYALGVEMLPSAQHDIPIGYLAVERGAPLEGAVDRPPVENEAESPLGNGTTLIGYGSDRQAYRPGETLTAKVHWQATGEPTPVGVSACLGNGKFKMCQPVGIAGGPDWQPGRYYTQQVKISLHPAMLEGTYRLALRTAAATLPPSAQRDTPLGEIVVQGGEKSRPVARLGEADWAGDALLSPDGELTVSYRLDAPTPTRLIVDWTGRAELPYTRVDAYVAREDGPDDYLGTVEVDSGEPSRSVWTIPQVLTAAGENALALRASAEPDDLHRLGWRGVLDRLFPDLLDEASGPWSGSVQIDLIRVECDWSETWDAYHDLMQIYAEREMWADAAGVYENALSHSARPEDIGDLALLGEVARNSGLLQTAERLQEEEARLIPNPLSIGLGGKVRLEGYEFRRERRQVQGKLYFRALEAMDVDWTMWLHATPEDPAALSGDEPGRHSEQSEESAYVVLDQRLDTSHWAPGRLYEARVSKSLPAGRYQVRLGVWRWEDGSRLWRDDAPDEHEVNLGWMEW